MVWSFPRRTGFPLLTLVLATLAGGCPSRDEGGVSQFVSSLVDATPTDCDTDPIADAGADLEAADPDGDGYAYVYLNALASTPTDNIVTYSWLDDGKALAAGDYILVRLSVGSHPLTLRIEDACGREANDTVNVVVNSAAWWAEPASAPD